MISADAVPALAFGIGVVAGLRSMTAPAAVAIAKRSPILAAVFVLAALVELVFDKLPKTPSRLAPPPLVARCISGAACAYFLVGGVPSAVLGVAGALAGSYAGAAFRQAYPRTPAAVAEDLLAVGLAAALAASSI